MNAVGWIFLVGVLLVFTGITTMFVPKLAQFSAFASAAGLTCVGFKALLDSLFPLSFMLAGLAWVLALLIIIGAAIAARKERAHGKRT